MCFLWWRQRHNHFWLLDNIFLPGALNGLSGLLLALVNVYTTPEDTMGVSSIVTLAITGAYMIICGGLTGFYWFPLLGRIRAEHADHNQGTSPHGRSSPYMVAIIPVIADATRDPA